MHEPIETYGRCRSESCRAHIFWAVSTVTHGQMPIDADPVESGNIVVTRGGRYPLVMVYATGAAITDGPRYQAHFVSCPEANSWRKR